jgi:D-ribulokinase
LAYHVRKSRPWMAHIVGVDVGTGSVRAAVFDVQGVKRGAGSAEIHLHTPRSGHYEQSSRDIWAAVGSAVRAALAASAVSVDSVRGIAFDATCSLVVVGPTTADAPVASVTDGADSDRDVIVWMDHRAELHAQRANETGHRVLQYVGGVISPEMQVPKLMWLKEHKPHLWASAQVHMHTHTHTHMARTRTHTYTHAHAHAHVHTRTHTHTHTYTHVHTRTRTSTHTRHEL